ncbi:MAG TPA: hypothetical protein VLG38_02150 [Gammaproteobacteria bacterium]|nr:hypothetical protein [Gammaproteobacteria bacterium]
MSKQILTDTDLLRILTKIQIIFHKNDIHFPNELNKKLALLREDGGDFVLLSDTESIDTLEEEIEGEATVSLEIKLDQLVVRKPQPDDSKLLIVHDLYTVLNDSEYIGLAFTNLEEIRTLIEQYLHTLATIHYAHDSKAIKQLIAAGLEFTAAELGIIFLSSTVENKGSIITMLAGINDARANLVKAIVDRKHDYDAITFFLNATKEPALSIPDLEEILARAAHRPSDYSPMLICSAIAHLLAYPDWKNYDVIVNEHQSFWEDIYKNGNIKSLLILPAKTFLPVLLRNINATTRPWCLQRLFVTAFDSDRVHVSPNVTWLTRPLSKTAAETFFNHHYLTNESELDFAYTFIMHLMTNKEDLVALTYHMTTLSPRTPENIIIAFLNDLTHSPEFIKQWQAQQDALSILCLLKISSKLREKGFTTINDRTALAKFATPIQQALVTMIRDLPDEPAENTIGDLKQLLDHLYVKQGIFGGLEKTLFFTALRELRQRFKVDSDVLETLDLNGKYGNSLAMLSVGALECFCNRPQTKLLELAGGINSLTARVDLKAAAASVKQRLMTT